MHTPAKALHLICVPLVNAVFPLRLSVSIETPFRQCVLEVAAFSLEIGHLPQTLIFLTLVVGTNLRKSQELSPSQVFRDAIFSEKTSPSSPRAWLGGIFVMS